MRRLRLVGSIVVLVAALAGCAGEASESDGWPGAGELADRGRGGCGVPAGDVQIEDGVGVLRPGVRVSELRAQCRVVRDTTVTGVEGMPVRTVVVALGADSAVAEVREGRVWRLRLTSERFRGPGGIGVGTPARRLEMVAGAGAYAGKGEVYVLIRSRCGVSYRLAGADLDRVASAATGEEALAVMPESAVVDLVLLWRCGNEAGRRGSRRSDLPPRRRVSSGANT
jgi:hypothetical protein